MTSLSQKHSELTPVLTFALYIDTHTYKHPHLTHPCMHAYTHSFYYLIFCLFETGLLCIALAVLELAL